MASLTRVCARVCARAHTLHAAPAFSTATWSSIARASASCGFVAPVPAAAVPSMRMSTSSAAPSSPAYTVTDVLEPAPSVPQVKRGWYKLRSIPGHTKKLNSLARQIAGKSVNEAMAQMKFSPSQRAKQVFTAVQRAAMNADFYHALTPNDLVVEEAVTGKHQTSARLRHHSKGRTGRSHWRTAQLMVRVREMREDEKHLNKFPFKPSATTKAALDPRGY